MNTVYKYCDAGGIKILENLELKITPPNQFNDPFEFTPRMICSVPNRRTREIVRTKAHLKTLYEGEKAAGLFKGNFRQYRQFVHEHPAPIVDQISRWLPEAALQSQRSFPGRVSSRFGILCMSRTRESILMWGHYGKEHSGIVIGFDACHSVFGAGGLKPITYIRERVVFDASWLERDPRICTFEKQIVFSKNADWSYEQESRQMFKLETLKKKPLGDGKVGYFLPFPPDALRSVTLGARCSAETEKKVRSALQHPRLSHVTIDRAALHQSEFALEFA